MQNKGHHQIQSDTEYLCTLKSFLTVGIALDAEISGKVDQLVFAVCIALARIPPTSKMAAQIHVTVFIMNSVTVIIFSIF